jgi:hypothetical protein
MAGPKPAIGKADNGRCFLLTVNLSTGQGISFIQVSREEVVSWVLENRAGCFLGSLSLEGWARSEAGFPGTLNSKDGVSLLLLATGRWQIGIPGLRLSPLEFNGYSVIIRHILIYLK